MGHFDPALRVWVEDGPSPAQQLQNAGNAGQLQPAAPAETFQNAAGGFQNTWNPQGGAVGAAVLQAQQAEAARQQAQQAANNVAAWKTLLGYDPTGALTAGKPNVQQGSLTMAPPIPMGVLSNTIAKLSAPPDLTPGKPALPNAILRGNSGTPEKFLQDTGIHIDDNLIIPHLQFQALREQNLQKPGQGLGALVSTLTSNDPNAFLVNTNPTPEQKAQEQRTNKNSPENLQAIEDATNQAEKQMAESYRKAVSSGKDQQQSYDVAKQDLNANFDKNTAQAIQENMANRAIQAQQNFDQKQAQYLKDNPAGLAGILHGAGQLLGGLLNRAGQSGAVDFSKLSNALPSEKKIVSVNAFGGFGGGLRTASTAEKLLTAARGAEQAATAPGVNLLGTTNAERLATGATTPQEVAQAATGQKLGILDRTFGRVRNNLEKLGAGSVSDMLQGARDTHETTLANWVNAIPTIQKLSGKEATNFSYAAQGLAEPMNGKVAQAVQEWADLRPQILQHARQTGLDVGELQNFFPRYFDPSFYKSGQLDRVAESIRGAAEKNGEKMTLDEAKGLLTQFREDAGAIRNRKSSLEFSRTSGVDHGYRTDKGVVFDYLHDVARRTAEVKHFGIGDNKALQAIGELPHESQKDALRLFNTAVEATPQSSNVQAASRAFRSANALTKLGLGAITNLQQSANTAALYGIGNTAKAITKYGTESLQNRFGIANPNEAHDFARQTGTILDSVLKDVKSGAGFSGEGKAGAVAGKIGAPLFNPVERFNRGVASYAGKQYAEQMATKAAQGSQQAVRALNELGLDGNSIAKTGALSQGDAVQAARKAVEYTQFKVDPQDLPAWASSPLGRVVSQFRTFGYNQTALAGRMVNEALHRNVAPLARFAAIGTPVGYGATKATDFLRYGVIGQNAPPRNLFDYFTKSGGLGLPTDTIQSLQYINQTKDPGKKLAAEAGILGGPSASTIVGGLNAVNSTRKGDLPKWLTQQIPIVGPTLAHSMNTAAKVSSSQASTIDSLVGNYQSLREAGAAVGPNVTLNDNEKQMAAKYLVNQNGNLKSPEQLKTEFAKLPDGPLKKQLQILSSQVLLMQTSATGLTVEQAQHAKEQQTNRGFSPVDQFRQNEGEQKTAISQNVPTGVSDFAGLSDPEQRKFLAQNPQYQSPGRLSVPADSYQQQLINAGLITPFTSPNQQYAPGQAAYTGKGQSRLGLDPAAILSGALQIQKSAAGGTRRGGRGRVGSRRGGARKGGVRKASGGRGRVPKLSISRGKTGAGRPPTILGLPRINPGRVQPLDQALQNLQQIRGSSSPADIMNVLHPQRVLKPVNPLETLFGKRKKARV